MVRSRLLIPLGLAVATPAWAQDAPAHDPLLDIDVTELTVTGRGGVQTMAVHQVMDVLDDLTEQCYATAHAQAPKLAGTLTISFKLDPKTTVSSVVVTGMPSVNTCLVAAIKAAHFYGPGKGPIEIREKVRLSASARQAGLLGMGGSVEPGAFASLTGTGDLSGGFDDPNIYGGIIGVDSGSGARIGHGNGTAPVPVVVIGQPEARGNLDKAIIRRYIKRNAQKIQYCYEKQLLDAPNLAGTVTAKFTIGTDGKVTTATATGLGEVSTCVAGVVQNIEFPRPKDGEVVVSYPFVFRPADKKP